MKYTYRSTDLIFVLLGLIFGMLAYLVFAVSVR